MYYGVELRRVCVGCGVETWVGGVERGGEVFGMGIWG